MEEKAAKRFRYIKKLINDKNDTKSLIHMFYFNKKAINFCKKLEVNYFLNDYYNLQALDILLMIDESENIKEVYKQLLKEYDENYAKSLWGNFIACLERNL